jgi:hypothetical protein
MLQDIEKDLEEIDEARRSLESSPLTSYKPIQEGCRKAIFSLCEKIIPRLSPAAKAVVSVADGCTDSEIEIVIHSFYSRKRVVIILKDSGEISSILTIDAKVNLYRLEDYSLENILDLVQWVQAK